MSDYAAVLRQTLVQHTRAMHELGWTMVAVQPELALDRLVAERDRYRAALKQIRDEVVPYPYSPQHLKDMAREALKADDRNVTPNLEEPA